MHTFLFSCFITGRYENNENMINCINVYTKFDHQKLTQDDLENFKVRVADKIMENEQPESTLDNLAVTILNFIEIE